MKKVIITGANGQLGRAINEIFAGDTEYELINTDFNVEGIKNLDITNCEQVCSFFDEVKPYAVINCAAHTAVDLCEVQKDAAYRINAIGPRNLAIAASNCDAKIIHVSTDYVFPGNASSPITEFDTPAPKAMYGITKLAGENFVKEFADGRWFIIRTAWLYGDGKNFVKTMLKLSENHDTLTVVDDQVGSPTSAKELARMIKYLLPTQQFGLYHGTCEGQCSWADFAKEIFRLAGKSTVVTPVTSEQYKEMNPNSADRPKYSVLDNYMLKLTSDFMFADWKDAIKEYMDTL